MFRKILIANRGEIACRVVRACREMNISTVAVYSDADRDALHVRMADEAYDIGPPPSSESYLRGDKIIDAALRSGAEAIHPGYGFLSENADFVRHVTAAGLTFIGPTPDVMEAMGGKISARKIAIEAGVPVVPGTTEPLRSFENAKETAAEMGYPIMLKASAGGGGKGMRLVVDESELKSALETAQAEAKASFGDDAVYIEKAIVRPRHIEIQIFSDTQGNHVHLGERECSIQRRHQKVIEEAPSPINSAELRQNGRVRRFGCKGSELRRCRDGRVLGIRPGQIVLLFGDEHASSGRASGNRACHRHRPCARTDQCSCGKAAFLHAARRSAIAATRSSAAYMPRIRTIIFCRRPARSRVFGCPRAGRPRRRRRL